ncbi:MAG: alpha-amylase family glycosyl hydrolase [Bacteroidales bacterium]
MRTIIKSIFLGSLAMPLFFSCQQPQPQRVSEMRPKQKPVIYQVMTRLFGNDSLQNVYNGTIDQNGVGKFNDFTTTALDSIRAMGFNHIWYTGVIAHGSKTDYSAYGIPKNHPGTIKGNAGSPYAIRDYYDVDPDMAVDVDNRMNEFESLVKRSHESGLKVILDFVPNHVAREYKSIKAPEGVVGLGDNDDTTKAFDVRNNFYYLPGQKLRAQFDTEGYVELPAKATGNDVFSATPSRDDWYETIKLNYGVDYVNGKTTHFDEIPDTWTKMRDILLFWSAKGIDGFRTDMAEMVPVEFWQWAIPQVRAKYPEMVFIAEIYNSEAYRAYIKQGDFDYLYDKVGLYDTLKYVIQGKSPASAIQVSVDKLGSLQSHMLNFLENHDEQRIASADFAGVAEAGIPMMIVSATYNDSPVMVYFGQELGEEAKGAEGFGGDDGRTTIFDYYGIDKIKRWRNGGKYDGGQLTAREKSLQQFYKHLLNTLNAEKAITLGSVTDLTEANRNNPDYNAKTDFAYIRKQDNELILGVVNFSDQPSSPTISIPTSVFKELGIPTDAKLKGIDLLSGSKEQSVLSSTKPFKVTLQPYSGKLIKFVF